MRKMHDVDFTYNRGFLIPCNRAVFVYTTILRGVLVFFTVPTQNYDLLYHDCPVKNVPYSSVNTSNVSLYFIFSQLISKIEEMMSLKI